MVKYVVRLTEEERVSLTELVGKGRAAALADGHFLTCNPVLPASRLSDFPQADD